LQAMPPGIYKTRVPPGTRPNLPGTNKLCRPADDASQEEWDVWKKAKADLQPTHTDLLAMKRRANDGDEDENPKKRGKHEDEDEDEEPIEESSMAGIEEEAHAGQGDAPLPPLAAGWQAVMDKNSGREYYFEVASGKTVWDRPEAPAEMNEAEEEGAGSKEEQEVAEEGEEVDIVKLKQAIIDILLPKEKVSKALKRLRGTGKKPSEDGQKDFNVIMEASNILIERGEFGMYETSRETLEEDLQGGGNASEDILWEYKLSEDGEEHGPFTSAQMVAWSEQGYFENAVLVRMRDSKLEVDSTPFCPSTEVDFGACVQTD